MPGTKLAKEPSLKNTRRKTEMIFNPGKMNPFPEFASIGFRGRYIYFKLDDGRKITIPISSFPKLDHATLKERENFHTNGVHVFWDDIDEIIGVKNILGPGTTKY